MDDGPWSFWRSSGVLVATQLGSGAWLRNACSVSEDQALAVLRAASSVVSGGASAASSPSSTAASAASASEPQEGPWTQEQLTAVTAAANAALLKHDEPQALQYLVREPAARSGMSGGGASSGDGPGSTVAPHSLGRRVRVRPTGWNMVASIDGLPPMRLPNGCVLSLEIEPDTERWLRTIK